MKIYCPTCKKEVGREDNKWKPFCSRRCKIVGLGEWASENYKIAEISNGLEQSTRNFDEEID